MSKITMRELLHFNFICVIALFPLRTQEYNIPNGSREGEQNTNEMEVLNRYNEMHTKDYGESPVSVLQHFIKLSLGQDAPSFKLQENIEKTLYHLFPKIFFMSQFGKENILVRSSV